MKVLLVEDDPMIGENIQIALESEANLVDWLSNGEAAETALQFHSYDVLLLDLSLPQRDGMEILKALRKRGDTLPVLVMTARDAVPDRVRGLHAGADDYLVKPFDLDELLARMHALVRRSRGRADTSYICGEVVVNTTTRQVFVGEEQVILSSREWTILDALVARPGAILSRSRLEDQLFGATSEIESNAVEVYIHGLRKKLGQKFIVNVRGVGYMVEKSVVEKST
ncbi:MULTISPECIES: response regulator [Undibacterium]|uniref:Response regulator n=1 Tax=Undibacterium umbellatum TaxID=2762300 RepID=A0ABR6ZBS5_9BURK|nr:MULTISPECIES: response regulator [Undibacterium]MBC3909213.1 response regulator [Undibacterium umbellatum]MDP1976239.1 response regulator [Undibacterium sp.]